MLNKGALTENASGIMKISSNLGSLPGLEKALTACPMCHSRDIWVESSPNSARSFSIMCRECRFQVSLLPRAEAIAAWNSMGSAD
jgi:hypothetical protein